MARTLAEQLKLGSQLVSTSQEEAQKLAEQKGMAAAPTTPLGQALMGVNPDQAKMAGTPPQKATSFQKAAGAPQKDTRTLGQAQRLDQTRSQEQDPEKQAREKAAQLQQLGSLGTRVQDMMRTQIWEQARLAAPEQRLQAVETPDVEQYGVEAAKAEDLKQLLTSYANNPSNQTLVEINKMLGRDINTALTPEDFVQFYNIGEEAAGKFMASATPDQISMSEVDATKLGYADANELAAAMGIPTEQLNQMTLAQFQQTVQSQTLEKFNKVDELRQKLQDPNLGAAEREVAQRELAELGQVGVTGTEAKQAATAGKVAASDNVTIGEESYKVSELLSDPGMIDFVEKYLLGTDEYKNKIKEQAPQLAQWMDATQGDLKELVTEAKTDVEGFQQLQQDNLNKADTAGGRLSESVMKNIYSDYGDLKADAYESTPLLDTINSSKNAGNVVSSINQIASSTPEVVKELTDLDPAHLKQLQLDWGNTSKLDNYAAFERDRKTIEKISDNDPDTLLSMIFDSPNAKPDQVHNSMRVLKNWQLLTANADDKGVGQAYESLRQILDKDNDGNLDNPTTIKESLLSYMGGKNTKLEDVAEGTGVQRGTGSLTLGSLQQAMAKATEGGKAILLDYMRGNQIIGLPQGQADRLGLEDVEQLLANRSIVLDAASKQALERTADNLGSERVSQVVASASRSVGDNILLNNEAETKVLNDMVKGSQGPAASRWAQRVLDAKEEDRKERISKNSQLGNELTKASRPWFQFVYGNKKVMDSILASPRAPSTEELVGFMEKNFPDRVSDQFETWASEIRSLWTQYRK